MKLDPGVTVYYGGRRFKGDVPDSIAEVLNLNKPSKPIKVKEKDKKEND